MARPCTCKEAIAVWEKAHEDTPAADAIVVEMQFQWPPIEKMDGALSTLVACEKMSLSSNSIDKIAGIAGMKSLKILSLGRNNIKSLSGIETVSDTLEELWISYNPIDKLKSIGSLKLLRVLYMSNNLVKEWVEFNRLQDCPSLKDLVFIGNPICENQPDVETWRTQASTRLQQITKLDGMARRPTSCKEALANWAKAHEGLRAEEATEVELQFQWPPIEKMDGALSTLVACEKLSLSSNMIDKITGIGGLKNLKILSIGRNNIKSLAGIETVSETLEQLWISYNPIEKLKGIGTMKLLRVLYMSNNLVKDWSEFDRLQECPALRDLVFVGNPVCESEPDVDKWRAQVSNRLQQIEKLDGIPIVRHPETVSEFPCPE